MSEGAGVTADGVAERVTDGGAVASPTTLPVRGSVEIAYAPMTTATTPATRATPANAMNRGISNGLHAGRPRPARAWGVVRAAILIARFVEDVRSTGPSSSHAASATSGSRGVFMPTGSPR